MLKILARLGQLSRLGDVIDDVISFGFKLLAAKEMFAEAVPDEVLDLGEIKGARLFGREFDMPLRPHIRR